MNYFRFTDRDGEVDVMYKVDALKPEFENFTVHEVVGLSDAEEAVGIQFGLLTYSRKDFIDFAEQYNLNLEFYDHTLNVATVIRAVDTTSSVSMSL